MPEEHPYRAYPEVIIRFMDTDNKTDRDAWKTATLGLLDQIRHIPLGDELMDEIHRSGRNVYVQPALAQGNQCAPANKNCYVLLRQAYEGLSGVFSEQLRTAFDRAERYGISLRGIARRLLNPGAPATTETAKNVARQGAPEPLMVRARDSSGKYLKNKKNEQVWKDGKMTLEKMEELLRGLCDDSIKPGELDMKRGGRSLADDLFRAFYIPNAESATEYCPRGAGCNATISFDPFKEVSCWNDVLVYRPPGIGLVHEMIHAYRNIMGLRYFKDKEKTENAPTPDDEIMTTGFPPYQYEKYSENRFRGLWGHDPKWPVQQQFRTTY